MSTFEDLLLASGCTPYLSSTKYSPAGKTYSINTDEIHGIYWFYETNGFIVDIHDFYIKKDILFSGNNNFKPFMQFISSYNIVASGEWIDPYQNMASDTMFALDGDTTHTKYLLHGNYPFHNVGINFKHDMIKEFIIDGLSIEKNQVSEVFFETKKSVLQPIKKIVYAIINCKMNTPSADLFFEAKAREWLSITLHAYMNHDRYLPLPSIDEDSIENVANYINDHYALNIPQSLLESIAMMSGTKLKQTFKQKYKMSITEYTQRKRMSIAETLLISTSLDICDISKAVGYTSHSRFSSIFKRYKGLSPKEVRSYSKLNM